MDCISTTLYIYQMKNTIYISLESRFLISVQKNGIKMLRNGWAPQVFYRRILDLSAGTSSHS
jgi:hypothetical protein